MNIHFSYCTPTNSLVQMIHFSLCLFQPFISYNTFQADFHNFLIVKASYGNKHR